MARSLNSLRQQFFGGNLVSGELALLQAFADAGKNAHSLLVGDSVPMGGHAHWPTGNGWNSNDGLSGAKAESSRTRHTAPFDVISIQVAYVNLDAVSCTVAAAVEYPLAATRQRVYFRGAVAATIDTGGLVVSDPIVLRVPKGTNFYIRTTRQQASGTWTRQVQGVSANNEGSALNTTQATDLSVTGTISNGDGYVYGPAFIRCQPSANARPRSVGVIGDSIVTITASGPLYDEAYTTLAMKGNVGFAAVGKSGERASQFVDLATQANRLEALKGCTDVYVAYGHNDLYAGTRTPEQVQADLQTIYDTVKSLGIARVWGATVTPYSSSSDSWATTGNQTAQELADRTALNTWIRTVPSPLYGIVDVADVVETARNSGIWKAGWTADGTHPNNTAKPPLAAAFASALGI